MHTFFSHKINVWFIVHCIRCISVFYCLIMFFFLASATAADSLFGLNSPSFIQEIILGHQNAWLWTHRPKWRENIWHGGMSALHSFKDGGWAETKAPSFKETAPQSELVPSTSPTPKNLQNLNAALVHEWAVRNAFSSELVALTKE